MSIGLDTGESFNSMYDLLMGNEGHSTSDEASDKSEQPVISNNTRDLVVIRHGETANNEKDLTRGWGDMALTPEGKEEATKLGENLKDEPDVLVSSDLKRAKQTADIISKQSGIPLAGTDPRLRTWNIGDYEGKPCAEADPILSKYVKNPDIQVPGGESFNDFKTRVLGGIEDIMNQHQGKVGIVTHSKVQQLLNATEKGDWQHVDADHFNDAPESPGHETTMSIPEAMLMPTDEAARAIEYLKAGPANQYLQYMHNQLNKMREDNFNPFNFSSRKHLSMMGEDDTGLGTEGEIKNLHYGIPAAGVGKANPFVMTRSIKPDVMPEANDNREDSLENDLNKLQFNKPLSDKEEAKFNQLRDFDKNPMTEEEADKLIKENPELVKYVRALNKQNAPKPPAPYVAVDNTKEPAPSTTQQLEDWFKEKYPNLDK